MLSRCGLMFLLSYYILGVMRCKQSSTSPGRMSYTCFGRIGVIPDRLLPRSSCIGSASGGGYAHTLATQTIFSTNTANRKGLTEHHSLGSRSLARVSHEATSDENVANAFIYLTRKAYPNYLDTLEIVMEEYERMLTETAREEHPYLDKTGIDLACREIDQADPYIRARVWANIYPSKGSHHRMPLMGAKGNKLLKDIVRFRAQSKGRHSKGLSGGAIEDREETPS